MGWRTPSSTSAALTPTLVFRVFTLSGLLLLNARLFVCVLLMLYVTFDFNQSSGIAIISLTLKLCFHMKLKSLTTFVKVYILKIPSDNVTLFLYP